uniref:NADH-ubiquinone oxidoreductase chain 6 n=1 Tax=Pseudocleopatra dartevellei TaxID=2650574 RepID=A0A5J6E376_9CAEN|nr:NADH dehydrogenase subunit 6 [Pseudocleopatra dartevellei]QEU52726.1 NADH dehydrogenase subunit 6 [Pseudocleopatra dartevellei]
MFPLMAQPLSLGLSIMISTMFFCVLVGLYLSSWYGYILFLIYVGGLLVMFAYVAALSPNVLFGGANSFLFFMGAQVFIPIIMFNSIFLDSGNLLPFPGQHSSLITMKTLGTELVSPSFISILISLGLILLINLIVVVKICYYQYGTLRPYKATYANPNSKNTPSIKNS